MSEPPKPALAIFDARAIAVAMFLGSPIAGAALWAVNEVRVGRPGRALAALATGLAVTAALLAIGAVGIPSSVSLGLSIGATVGAHTAAQAWERQLRAEDRFEITHASMAIAVGAGGLGCLGVLGLLALTLAGSDLTEGDACDEEVASCIDGATALWCDHGVVRRIGCHGEGGCRESLGEVRCTPTIGDACVGATSTCEGTASWIRCVDGVIRQEASCRGPGGCRVVDRRLLCDGSLAVVGDACWGLDGMGACTPDHASWVTCVAGTWQPHHACRGPDHCATSGEELSCDESIGAIGDACDEGGYACSEDGRLRLVCENGTRVRDAACPEGCRVEAGDVLCPNAVSARGAP